MLDGTPAPGLTTAVLGASDEETSDGMARCELVLGNWGLVGQGLGFVLSDRSLADFGRALALDMGEGNRRGRVFAGAITGLEEHSPPARAPQLVVLAEDRLQALRMTRRTRTFDDVTDADVARRVATEHGLRCEADVDGPRHRALAQLNQSDLAFLRERARAVDAQLWLAGDTLHLQARARRDAGAVTLTYGADLREFSVLADLAHQRTAIGVTGWDVAAKAALEQEAAEAALGRELAGGTGGATVLQRAFGARVERVVHRVPIGADEARALAEAHFRCTARRFVTGTGTAEGDARITVGAHVDLAGLSPGFAGRYYVTEVRHHYDLTGGYRTTFGVERPFLAAVS
ncbi:MAG: phage late control D family protein [Acidimicrobiia bacterium]